MLSERKILVRAALVTGLIATAGIVALLLVHRPGSEQNDTGALSGASFGETASGGRLSSGADLANLPAARGSAPVLVPAEPADIEFIQQVFPLISQWDLGAVQPYFAQATLNSASEQYAGYQDVLNVLSERLGELYSFEEPRRIAGELQHGAREEDVDLKEYSFRAFYAQGNADVSLTLVDQPGSPGLYAFQFDIRTPVRAYAEVQ